MEAPTTGKGALSAPGPENLGLNLVKISKIWGFKICFLTNMGVYLHINFFKNFRDLPENLGLNLVKISKIWGLKKFFLTNLGAYLHINFFKNFGDPNVSLSLAQDRPCL